MNRSRKIIAGILTAGMVASLTACDESAPVLHRRNEAGSESAGR